MKIWTWPRIFMTICMWSTWSLVTLVSAQGPASIIRSLLQNNLVGAPVVHKVTEWEFDPDVSVKRRDQFYELHGYRGEKLIERLGLGIDGNAAERLAKQRSRDAGKLGGVLDLLPNPQDLH